MLKQRNERRRKKKREREEKRILRCEVEGVICQLPNLYFIYLRSDIESLDFCFVFFRSDLYHGLSSLILVIGIGNHLECGVSEWKTNDIDEMIIIILDAMRQRMECSNYEFTYAIFFSIFFFSFYNFLFHLI